MSARLPSRSTRAEGTCSCASASTLAWALRSWFAPSPTFRATRAPTRMPVDPWPIAMLAIATASSMMFMGSETCPRMTLHRPGGGSWGSEFGPWRVWRSSASAAERPSPGVTPSASATSGPGTA